MAESDLIAPGTFYVVCASATFRSEVLQSYSRVCKAYFKLLHRVLRNAPRGCVLENLRQLFIVFLQAFEAPQVPLVERTEVNFTSFSIADPDILK